MNDKFNQCVACRWAACVCAVLLMASCQVGQNSGAQPMGSVKSSAKIGTAKMSLDQVQAEVENFADQFVLNVTETTNQLSRGHPEAAPRLHAVKLSVARGAFIIASGPNPVVAMLDLVVQATLLHHTTQRAIGQSLPEEASLQLVATFERARTSAWSLAERVLTPQELADLRGLIESWIEQNPNVTYVAGVRFSDFARMRPKQGSAPRTIFGLLQVDPFASIDPAAREIQESRLLAERVFYYVQRAPQLLSWQMESLYNDLARTPQSQQMLANLNDITATSKQLNETIAQLPTRTREELANSEQTVTSLLNEVNQSLDRTTQALQQVEQSAATLRETSQAVVEAGRAWEATADAVGKTAAMLNPPKPPGAPPSEAVTIHDVTSALQEAQKTAIEMRMLLEEFANVAREDELVTSVNSSVAEARRGAQDVVITAAICAAALIVMTFAGAFIYRASGRRSTGAASP